MQRLGNILGWLLVGFIAFALMSGVASYASGHHRYQSVNNDRPGSGATYSGNKQTTPQQPFEIDWSDMQTISATCTSCGKVEQIQTTHGDQPMNYICDDCRN